MRHEHRQGLLMHEVEGHPSEQPFEKQRNGARSETARRAKAWQSAVCRNRKAAKEGGLSEMRD